MASKHSRTGEGASTSTSAAPSPVCGGQLDDGPAHRDHPADSPDDPRHDAPHDADNAGPRLHHRMLLNAPPWPPPATSTTMAGVVGYSGAPLARKLGIKEGSRLALLDAPDGFDRELAPLPDGVTVQRRLSPGLDVALLFVTERRDLERRFDAVAKAVFPAGGFWVAWPKRASKVPTDLTEDVLRVVALPKGLVDNKVCAVTDVWSGLRLVWRKENRT